MQLLFAFYEVGKVLLEPTDLRCLEFEIAWTAAGPFGYFQ
jgi:hypothetical protein